MVPRFAMTGHKAQGSTIENVYVADFGRYKSGMNGWLYVCLSRCKGLENLWIGERLYTSLHKYKIAPHIRKWDTILKARSAVTKVKMLTFFSNLGGVLLFLQ